MPNDPEADAPSNDDQAERPLRQGPHGLPPFAALRAFDVTFKAGGVRKAAKALGVNHAVVSRHLSTLEGWLGISLVERGGNQLALTDEGSRYHQRISAAFAQMNLATEELIGARDNIPFRLWCVAGLAVQWLSARVAEFEHAFPLYRVELRSTDVPANLSSHEADADIRYIADSDPALPLPKGINRIELARPEIIAVASPTVALQCEKHAGLNALTFWPFLHEQDEAEWKRWLELRDIECPSSITGPLCWHAHLLVAAAREGRGVALASRFLVEKDLALGSLVEVLRDPRAKITMGAYVLTAREDRWSSPILANLRNFLRRSSQRTTGTKISSPDA